MRCSSCDHNGNVTSRTDPLGHETDYSYDQDGRLAGKVVDPGSGHLADTWAYSYDA